MEERKLISKLLIKIRIKIADLFVNYVAKRSNSRSEPLKQMGQWSAQEYFPIARFHSMLPIGDGHDARFARSALLMCKKSKNKMDIVEKLMSDEIKY